MKPPRDATALSGARPRDAAAPAALSPALADELAREIATPPDPAANGHAAAPAPAPPQLAGVAPSPSDTPACIVARGIDLLRNELLLDRGDLETFERALLVTRAFQAVVTYGDALFLPRPGGPPPAGAPPRTPLADDVDPDFRDLYDEAVAFLQHPDFERYRRRDLAGWSDDVRVLLGPAHLAWERRRLDRAALTWHDYLDGSFRRRMLAEPASPLAWARKTARALRRRGADAAAEYVKSRAARLGYRMLDARGVLEVLLPVILFETDAPRAHEFARVYLGTATVHTRELRNAFLARWTIASAG